MIQLDSPNMNYCLYCKHRNGMRCTRALPNVSDTEYAYCYTVRFKIGMDNPCFGYAPTLRKRIAMWWQRLKCAALKGGAREFQGRDT